MHFRARSVWIATVAVGVIVAVATAVPLFAVSDEVSAEMDASPIETVMAMTVIVVAVAGTAAAIAAVFAARRADARRHGGRQHLG